MAGPCSPEKSLHSDSERSLRPVTQELPANQSAVTCPVSQSPTVGPFGPACSLVSSNRRIRFRECVPRSNRGLIRGSGATGMSLPGHALQSRQRSPRSSLTKAGRSWKAGEINPSLAVTAQEVERSILAEIEGNKREQLPALSQRASLYRTTGVLGRGCDGSWRRSNSPVIGRGGPDWGFKVQTLRSVHGTQHGEKT